MYEATHLKGCNPCTACLFCDMYCIFSLIIWTSSRTADSSVPYIHVVILISLAMSEMIFFNLEIYKGKYCLVSKWLPQMVLVVKNCLPLQDT